MRGLALAFVRTLQAGANPASFLTDHRVDQVTGARIMPRSKTGRLPVSSTAAAVITVTLDWAHPYAPATVSYAPADGTATGGSDYLPAEGTLTISPGSQSATFTVTILDDGDDEPDETILLSLSDPAGAALGEPAAATRLIADDDEPPSGHRLYLPAVTRQPGGGAAHRGHILALLAFWAPIVACRRPLSLAGRETYLAD